MTESIETKQMISLSSKKVRNPKPLIDDDELPPSKKIKTSRTASKIKASIKKPDVTQTDQAPFITEPIPISQAIVEPIAIGENNDTPSKKSLKPVSDYVKTPFSKIKENEEDVTTPVNGSIKKAIDERIEQPVFDEVKSASTKKEVIHCSQSGLKSLKKTPLTKINEVEDEITKKKIDEATAETEKNAEKPEEAIDNN